MKVERRTRAHTVAAILAILLAGPFCAARARTADAVTAFETTAKATAAKTTTKSAKLVDVNHATREQLVSLPGIQDAYAAKIVKHRPYVNKTQLLSEGVIPAATYRKIRALIIAKQ
jgi:competence protein ComEA